MAKNRKNQSAAIRFGPALKALLLCFLIAGSAVGYVWQKGQVFQLGQQIRQSESHLMQLQSENQRLSDQLAILRSPIMVDQRARELNLGLGPAQPAQVCLLPEPSGASARGLPGQLAARETETTTQ